jgi:DnaJ-class molecular chaperone
MKMTARYAQIDWIKANMNLTKVRCDLCHGSGQSKGRDCHKCQGKGHYHYGRWNKTNWPLPVRPGSVKSKVGKMIDKFGQVGGRHIDQP